MHSKLLVYFATDAILDIDLQYAFLPGGSLAVAGGDEILPTAKQNRDQFPLERRYGSIDCHIRGSVSFYTSFSGRQPCEEVPYAEYTAGRILLAPGAKFTLLDFGEYHRQVGSVVLWPEHALEGTREAELHEALSRDDYAFIVVKGLDVLCDSYSGFRDNLGRPTGLGDHMRAAGVRRVFIQGLAFDFCVGFSALDAVMEGFEVFVIEDATRSVNLPGSAERMRARLLAAGAHLIQSADLRFAA